MSRRLIVAIVVIVIVITLGMVFIVKRSMKASSHRLDPETQPPRTAPPGR